jgi:hypothetical protein
MNNPNVSQQEPSGFFCDRSNKDNEEPTGLFVGSNWVAEKEPKNNLIQSQKLPKAPSHGVGCSTESTTTTGAGGFVAVAETLSLGSGEVAAYIPGLEGRYCVTNFGRVFSLNYRRTKRAKELAQSTHPEGYRRVKLFAIDRESPVPVHRLVASAFIPNPGRLPQVNHIDGNKGNNLLSNLEWTDNSGNQKHAFETGLHVYAVGEDHAMAILSEQDVRDIRDELRRVPPFKGQQTDLARRYGVSNYCIFDIKHGRSWRHIK